MTHPRPTHPPTPSVPAPKLLARIAEPIRAVCSAVATRTAYVVIVATVETVKRLPRRV